MNFFLKSKVTIFIILIFGTGILFAVDYDFELETDESPPIYSGPSQDGLGKKFHSPWEINPKLFDIPRDATEINVHTERKWSRRYLVLPLMLSTFLGFGSGSELQGDMATFGPSLITDLFGWGMVIPGAIFHTKHYDKYGWDASVILEDLKKFFDTGAEDLTVTDGSELPDAGAETLLSSYGDGFYKMRGTFAGQDVENPPVDESVDVTEEIYTVPSEFYDAVQYSLGTVSLIVGSVALIVSRVRQIAAVPIFYEKEISLRTLLEKKRREQTENYYRSKQWHHYDPDNGYKPIWKGVIVSNEVSPSGVFNFCIGGVFSLRKR